MNSYLQSHSEAGCKEAETPQNRVKIIDIKELSKADNELLEWKAHRNWAFEQNYTWLGDASAQCPSHRYFFISTWHHVHYRGLSPEHESGIFRGPTLKSLELRSEAAKRCFCLVAQGLGLFLELEPVKLCLQTDIHEKAWSPPWRAFSSLPGERGERRVIPAVRNVSRLPAGLEDKVMKESTSYLHSSLYNCHGLLALLLKGKDIS